MASMRIRCRGFRPSHIQSLFPFSRVASRSFSHNAPVDPLHILFCGSDEFSNYSLQALHQLHVKNPAIVAGLDVVCRPDKRGGRGRKQLHQVPIKSVAQSLNLPLHQIDTFTDWVPPTKINLIVAVSFGLLVPARVLKGAKYGGLNIHPSLLPEFRGPAPIQHALLQGRSHTGVTLQEMHPTRFDHGAILDRTPLPGIPIPENSTPDEMIAGLGQLGAQMLAYSLESGAFAAGSSSAQPQQDTSKITPSHAPKITPEDQHINWESWTAERILRTDRVLGRLWDTLTYQRCMTGVDKDDKRVVFHGPWSFIEDPLVIEEKRWIVNPEIKAGCPILLPTVDLRIAFLTSDDKLIAPEAMTIDGGRAGAGVRILAQAQNRRLNPSS